MTQQTAGPADISLLSFLVKQKTGSAAALSPIDPVKLQVNITFIYIFILANRASSSRMHRVHTYVDGSR